MAKRKTSAKKVKRLKDSWANKEAHKLAHYAFFSGIIIAIITGLFKNWYAGIFVTSYQANMFLGSTLIVLGFIVGLFNLKTQETTPFLIACIALMMAGIVNFGAILNFDAINIGAMLRNVMSNIVVFVVPAALIVSMKTIWKLASD